MAHAVQLGHLAHVVSLYRQVGLRGERGTSTGAVEGLEEAVGRPLPGAYREFMLWAGHGAGDLLRGSRCFFHDIGAIQGAAHDVLEEGGCEEEMPLEPIVFWMHQGYQFLFFTLDAGDDPPLHYYNSADGMTEIAWGFYPSISEFLAREVIGHAQLAQEITGRRSGVDRIVDRHVPVHPREHDAERKLVDQIRAQYGGEDGQVYPHVRGEVKLVSDQPVCISCQWHIARLQRMYPNLRLIVKSVQQ